MRLNGSINVNNNLIGGASAPKRLKGEINQGYNPSKIIEEAVRIANAYTDSKVPGIYWRTTEEWNSEPQLKSEAGVIYIYSDRDTVEIDGETYYLPGMKIGDGKSYLINNPFVDYQFQAHLANDEIHITQEEREFWNNKVRGYMDEENGVLTLTKF